MPERIGLTKPSAQDRILFVLTVGNLKLYLTFVRKCRIIRVASWSEVKPTPS